MDEEGSEIRELGRDDRLRILTELRKHPHPLTHQSDSLYNIVNGQVVSETKVNVQDAVEIGQDTRTSFASSLPGGFHHPIKKTVETMQVLKRGVKIKGKLSTTWTQFSYLPRSLTSTAASVNGARQCGRDNWESTYFREATQSQIRALLLSVPQLSERKHLVECYQAWNIPKQEEPASTEIATPTDANLALHV